MNTPNSEIKTPRCDEDKNISRDPEGDFISYKLGCKLEQELQRLKQWKEENYDRNKNQWLTSVGMVCEDFPNVAARIKELREELQQAREELANWKQCSTCEHDDKISLSTKLEIEHEARLEVVRQLSQWQECARAFRQNYNDAFVRLVTQEHPSSVLTRALSLYTKLTQEKSK